MSRKGQKGRSKKKRVDVAQASDATREARETSVLAEAIAGGELPEASTSKASAAEPIETPAAFEAPQVKTELDADDLSVPPVDLDSPFFAGDPHGDPFAEVEERDARLRLKQTPEAARRRAVFQRYVKLAVGAASVVCLAALVKVGFASGQEEPSPRRAAATQIATAPPALQPTEPVARPRPADEVPPPPAADPAPPGADTAVEAPKQAASPTTGDPTQPAATADAPAASGDAPTPTTALTEIDPKAAAKEKHDSQLALERGKVGDSIAAGERSVALDPSDAEAWLILGAAYQAKGDLASARRSFKACLEQGKRGPKWECAQMPH